ncbi:hypothetical protein GCM10025751_00310 [Haladaptatus pallidirubidus]|uniref:EamA domain-containing protein n=1 Tax=Haladaptatus pallidirubidus TaxID=1008152 RepID=A0AAV3UAY2_9EURY
MLLFASGLALVTRGVTGSSPADGLFAVLGVQVGTTAAVFFLFAFVVAAVYASRGGSLLDCLVLASAPLTGLMLSIWAGVRSSDLPLFELETLALCLLSGTVIGTTAYLVGLGVPRLVGQNRTGT